MKKLYIAPEITIVSFRTERGFNESTQIAPNETMDLFMLMNSGQQRNVEQQNINNTWGGYYDPSGYWNTGDNHFWY